MKIFNNAIIVMLVIASVLMACSNTRQIEHSQVYKIAKIDSLNNFYIVYATCGGQKFKIVSEKRNTLNCEKIRTGKSYPLKLSSILNQPIKFGDRTINSGSNLLVNCFMFDKDTEICRETNIPDLHNAENLIGLCYMK
jgi:hypothetical protein